MYINSIDINLDNLRCIEDGVCVENIIDLQKVLDYIYHHQKFVKIYVPDNRIIVNPGDITIQGVKLNRHKNIDIIPLNKQSDGWFLIWSVVLDEFI